jgi:hypothetical protein
VLEDGQAIFGSSVCSISCISCCCPLFRGACGEVLGPVASGVDDPADCGVDVHAEQVGRDGGGQVGYEGGERTVAGCPDL